MRKWIIASLLGVAIMSAVYFLWATRERPNMLQTYPEAPANAEGASTPSSSKETTRSGVPDEVTAPAASTPASSEETEIAEASEPTGSVTIDNAWARESTPQGVSAVYMVMILVADDIDRFKRARSSAADAVEIHETRIEGGIASMHRIDSLDIEPDTPVVFEPGGLHLMLIGLKHSLKTGDSVPLVLEFARAGTLTLEVPVGEPAGSDALGHGGDE